MSTIFSPHEPSYSKSADKKNIKFNILRENLLEAIEKNGGIISVKQAHECVLQVFNKYPWSTQNIENLSRFIVSCPEFFRIDLSIDYPKPLAIYPGHHRTSSTSFFVTAKENQAPDLDKAREFLKRLVDDAISRLSEKKSKPKNRKGDKMNDVEDGLILDLAVENENTNIRPLKTVQCHATLCRPN